MDLTCALCPRTDSAYICREHLTPYTRALDLAFAVLNDPDNGIQATVGRLDRMPERGGLSNERATFIAGEEWTTADGALRPTALPINLDAARRADTAVTELTTWARHIAEQRGIPLGTTGDRRPIHGPVCQGRWVDHPDGRMWQQCRHQQCAAIRHGRRPTLVPAAVACRFLASNAEWLRHRPEAVEAWPAIEQAARTLASVVDSPAERRYAGPCQATMPDGTTCTEELYAAAGRPAITCPGCGCVYDVATRTTLLLAQAADQLLPATEMARALSGLGRPVTAAMIRGYALRGRLVERGRTRVDWRGEDDPTYRIGDVVELLADLERRRAEQEARREQRDQQRRDEHRAQQAARLLKSA